MNISNELEQLLKASETDPQGTMIQIYKEIVALRSVHEAVLRWIANTYPPAQQIYADEMVKRAREVEREYYE